MHGRIILITGLIAVAFTGALSSRALAADPTVAAVGDMACSPAYPEYNAGFGTDDSCRFRYVSDLVVNLSPTAVLPLGDNQYVSGSLLEYQADYHPTFGRSNSIVYPSIGNAEYNTPGAQGFFDYFSSTGVLARIADGTARTTHLYDGYYSFDIGRWHLIALNSNCGAIGGCNVGSTQEKWLKADLAANADKCTLAYWHHPRWNTGALGNDSASSAFWTDLYAAHADLVLNGHGNHHYERFRAQNPSGDPDSNGLREFIVSTGGEEHGSPGGGAGNEDTTQVSDYSSFGILKLSLHADSFDWQFMPAAGDSFTDSGSASCHWPNAQPPAAPALSKTVDDGAVHLSWTAPADGGSLIRGYKLYRGTSPGNEALYKTLGTGTSYDDQAVENGKRYYYRVAATNGKGDGPQSNEVLGARPPGEPALTAEAGDGAVKLSWIAPPDGGAPITGYKIYRGTSSGNVSTLKTVGNVTSYTDAPVTNGRAYYYKVSAINSVDQGWQSDEASATPAPVPGAPWLTASLEGGSVDLSWNVPSSTSPILGYRVYRGTFPGGETLLATTTSATFTLDSGLVPGVTYYYRVAAVNRIGEGPRSDAVTVELALLPSPAGPLGPVGGSGVTSLKISPRSFVPRRSGAKEAKTAGALVTYTLSGPPAVISFTIEQAVPGVLRGGKCGKKPAHGHGGKRCTRFVRLKGSIDQAAVSGRNTMCFTGRLGRRTMAPGDYRLVGRPRGAKGPSASSSFRIARKRAAAKNGCSA